MKAEMNIMNFIHTDTPLVQKKHKWYYREDIFQLIFCGYIFVILLLQYDERKSYYFLLAKNNKMVGQELTFFFVCKLKNHSIDVVFDPKRSCLVQGKKNYYKTRKETILSLHRRNSSLSFSLLKILIKKQVPM